MILSCESCGKDIERHIFCGDRCRKRYSRGATAPPKKTKAELQKIIDAIPAHRDPAPATQAKPLYHSDPNYNYERGYDDNAAAIEI